jgi:hypothetical protein
MWEARKLLSFIEPVQKQYQTGGEALNKETKDSTKKLRHKCKPRDAVNVAFLPPHSSKICSELWTNKAKILRRRYINIISDWGQSHSPISETLFLNTEKNRTMDNVQKVNNCHNAYVSLNVTIRAAVIMI